MTRPHTSRQRAYILSLHRNHGDLKAVAADMGVTLNGARMAVSRPGPVREAWIRVRRCPKCGGKCDRVPPANICLACSQGHYAKAARRNAKEADAARVRAAEVDRLRAKLAKAEAEIERLLAVNARLRERETRELYRRALTPERSPGWRAQGVQP